MNPEPRRRFDLKEFKAISRAISTYEDVNILIEHVVEGIARAFKTKGASIMLYDEADGQLFRVSSYGVSDSYLKKGPIFLHPEDGGLASGEPVFIQDLQNDPRVQYPKEAKSENIHAMLSFPIKCRTAVVGMLRLYHSKPIALHPDDLDSIGTLLLHLGLVIEENGLRNFLLMVNTAIHSLPPRIRKTL